MKTRATKERGFRSQTTTCLSLWDGLRSRLTFKSAECVGNLSLELGNRQAKILKFWKISEFSGDVPCRHDSQEQRRGDDEHSG